MKTATAWSPRGHCAVNMCRARDSREPDRRREIREFENGYRREEQAKEGTMRVAMMVAAAGCVLVGLLFAKVSGAADWSGAIMATLFAGMAGALIAVAGG